MARCFVFSAVLLLSLCTTDAFKPRIIPNRVTQFIKKSRAPALPADVLEVYNNRFRPLGVEATTASRNSKLQSVVEESDVIALHAALVDAYGSPEAALAGCTQNPTLISPLYSSPIKIAESKAALLKVFEGSEEEVRNVLLQNPALLQCGSALVNQQPSEIQGFAAVRSLFDRVPPSASKALLVLVMSTTLLNIALAQSTDDAMVASVVDVLKPLLGTTFASLFVGTAVMLGIQEASSKRAKKASINTSAGGADYGASVPSDSEASESKQLLQQIKDAGVAGIVSYIFWEWAFWGVSIPVCLGGYYAATGHLPDPSNQEDVTALGAEAFAFVNVARVAVPLRIGLALSTVPWVQANVVDRFETKED